MPIISRWATAKANLVNESRIGKRFTVPLPGAAIVNLRRELFRTDELRRLNGLKSPIARNYKQTQTIDKEKALSKRQEFFWKALRFLQWFGLINPN
ncbi:hypothetical protein [Novosphingobium resinovorum]